MNEIDSKNLSTSCEFVCVNCLSRAESLYTVYSRDVIRITECKKCGSIVDKYVEYDNVLIFIDLILQYSTAYRHFLLNVKFESYPRLVFIFLLCDAYNKWIERRSLELTDENRIFDLEWKFYGALVQSLAEMSAYTLTIFLILYAFRLHKTLRAPFGRDKIRFYLSATFIGFYGNVFVVFSIIWKLHRHWTYRSLAQLFIFISHVQIQRTLCPDLSALTNCIIVICGTLVQLLAGLTVWSLSD